MSLDENLTNKHPGDPIRSKDWNALASETVRLDDTKLNRGLIGVQMLRAPSWNNETTSGDWQPVISQTVNFETGTSLLLVGQGHGLSSTSGVALDVVIRVNGTILGQDDTVGDLSWGAGLLQNSFGGKTSIWTQIVAIAECSVKSGESAVELAMRCRRPDTGKDGSVNFSAPTLWLIRLGAS
ncbi:hypothetical protein ADL01_02330 [Streptomyces sp. NRRL WC-3618]|uniref:hypothetical protein n=1 Tax=Streptomyces sp. NRRL WC-3618 TaxID=1519490 RepID=UPI0006AE511B|nr:hypothetical protein [Streptomyces sp. NRRL WC-3618]KOV88202.1 hypothetical protein ADL01_02330 [Streptomyces sp. NRRL WC-3618]